MRLDKFICASTEYSRIDAKRAIGKGRVTINECTVKSPAVKVLDTDVVCLNNEVISIIGERYIMLHKPQDFACSTIDEAHPSVLKLVDIKKAQNLHIAGRLDVDTTGLVLITDDGKWSHALTSPKRQCQKRYRVELAQPIEPAAIEQFAKGIQLHHEKQLTRPADLQILSPHQVVVTISEGKYHQVKRMFAAIGNKVLALHREAIGQIELDPALAPGEWRYLTQEEAQL